MKILLNPVMITIKGNLRNILPDTLFLSRVLSFPMSPRMMLRVWAFLSQRLNSSSGACHLPVVFLSNIPPFIQALRFLHIKAFLIHKR